MFALPARRSRFSLRPLVRIRFASLSASIRLGQGTLAGAPDGGLGGGGHGRRLYAGEAACNDDLEKNLSQINREVRLDLQPKVERDVEVG